MEKDDPDTEKLFKLLVQTRNPDTIPIAELHEVTFFNPIRRHVKED